MLNRSKTDAMTKLPSDLHWMSAWQIREAIVTRRLSATEVACHFIERIDTLDRRLHSFFTVSGEVALDQARAIDRRIDRGEPVGALAGVPVSIKDQFWTKGIRTTSGSRIYADHVPEEDSLHVARMKAADGVIIGKTARLNSARSGAPPAASRPNASIPGIPNARLAARAEGLRPVSPPGSARSRSVAIRVDRSVCPPPCAACSAYCRAMEEYRGTARSEHDVLLGVGPISARVRDAATLLQLLARPSGGRLPVPAGRTARLSFRAR